MAMDYKTIAGHRFIETTHGRICSVCNKFYVDISIVQKSDIGKTGWAHVGVLYEREYKEIQDENERMWKLLVGVATGNGPEIPQPDEPSIDDMLAGVW